MYSQEEARAFAEAWIAAWNAHDLDGILEHYGEDCQVYSPLIIESLGIASGRLCGKRQIGVYWGRALHALPDLRFDLIDVAIGVNSLVIQYRGVYGRKALETLFLDKRGKVEKAIAHYA